MNILQVLTTHNYLIQNNLHAGNRGVPPGKTQRRTLIPMTDNFSNAQSSVDYIRAAGAVTPPLASSSAPVSVQLSPHRSRTPSASPTPRSHTSRTTGSKATPEIPVSSAPSLESLLPSCRARVHFAYEGYPRSRMSSFPLASSASSAAKTSSSPQRRRRHQHRLQAGRPRRHLRPHQPHRNQRPRRPQRTPLRHDHRGRPAFLRHVRRLLTTPPRFGLQRSQPQQRPAC